MVIDGGGVRASNDTTPTISGTSDEAPGTPVSVTVGGQTLVTTVSSGQWSVVPAVLEEAAYDVSATIVDAANNVRTAHQVLTDRCDHSRRGTRRRRGSLDG